MNDTSNIINQIPLSMWHPLYNWSFISCCICMAILTLTAKRAWSQISPSSYVKGWVHGIFTLGYLILGLFAAAPKTYLVGSSYFQRAIVGVIAGGAALAVYHALIKRLSQVIGVKDNFLQDPDEKPEDETKAVTNVVQKPTP